MPMTRSTDAGVSQRTNVFAERKMLAWAMAVQVLDQFAKVLAMPKNKGLAVKYRRPRTFDAATTPLLEGVTPTPRKFRYDDVEANLKQYGDLIQVTDVIEDTHEDPVINDMAEVSGDNIGRTMEALRWGVLRGGLSVDFANGSERSHVNTVLSLSLQRAATRGLKSQKAKPITRILSGSLNFQTRPVEAAYVAVAHTDCEHDIRNLPGFTPVAEYGQRQPLNDHEIGSVENVRYILSPDLDPFPDSGGDPGSTVVSTTGSNADVYPILIIGQEAYGTVPLRGQGAIEPTILRPGVKDKSDPLGQIGFVGWKTYYTCVILNDMWMTRLEVAVSKL